jgi:hypothetical protein
MPVDDQLHERHLQRLSSTLFEVVNGRMLSSSDDGNSTSTHSNTTAAQDDSSGTSFDPNVFWFVNAFILVLICGTLFWCWRFGRQNWFLYDGTEGRQQSDEAYRQAVLRRQERQQQAKIDTPAQRTRKLLRSFQRHEVQMVSENT